jgi:hypothetical protein
VTTVLFAAQLVEHFSRTLLGIIPNLLIFGLVVANWRKAGVGSESGRS